MLGANQWPPLVEAQEACAIGTVYRSEHGNEVREWRSSESGTPGYPEDILLYEHARASDPELAGWYAIQFGAHPQLWISLWTDQTVQGRRPT
jgi:hypothetical protein